MNVQTFLQTCVNHGIKTVLTVEVATALRISRDKAYAELVKLRKSGVVYLISKGLYASWLIDLPASKPLGYDSLTDCTISYREPDDFAIASMQSMEDNCVRLTARPEKYNRYAD